MKRRIPIEFLARASRIYATCADAARALGISEQHYSRLCRKHNIETPYKRKQRLKKEAKRAERIEHKRSTPEEAEAAIDAFEERCRARVEAL